MSAPVPGHDGGREGGREAVRLSCRVCGGAQVVEIPADPAIRADFGTWVDALTDTLPVHRPDCRNPRATHVDVVPRP